MVEQRRMRGVGEGWGLAVVVVLVVVGWVCVAVGSAPPVIPSDECSGFGRIYGDTNGTCECFQCYAGSDCSQKIVPCVVDATEGNPLLFQEYWEINGTVGEVVIPSNYRTGYQLSSVIPAGGANLTGIQPYLYSAFLELHKQVGNAETEGYSVVIGNGATNLISAVVYALSMKVSAPIVAFAQTPFYDGYPNWAQAFPSISSWSTALNITEAQILEFVTSPNNPDGRPRTPFYPDAFHVYDCVYNWPHLTNVTAPVAADVTLFSMSKLTGHAGTRFGWALVKDPEIANYMGQFVGLVSISVSIDAQFRSLRLIQSLLQQPGDYFQYVREKMTQRWETISALFDPSTQSRFSLQSVPGQFYLWIQCLYPEDAVNCAQVFETEGGVQGLPGPLFGGGNDYLRIEIVDWDPVFDILASNIMTLMTNSK